MPDRDDAAEFNQHLGGWNDLMGLRFTRVTQDECIGEFTVDAKHLQPYGVVHGGVHCGVIEAACSTGAAAVAMARGQTVVGLENSTSFVHASRGGRLKVHARPLTRGRRTQVWTAEITDEHGKVLATGRVRLLCLDPGAELAGEKSGVR